MTKAMTSTFMTGLVLLCTCQGYALLLGLTAGTRRQMRGAQCRAQLGSATDLQTHELSKYYARYTVKIS